MIKKCAPIALALLLQASAGLFAADKPNVLILYADDIGYGDLSCYNKESKIPTPHLDKLAEQGMRFTDAHSSSGICTPSRYALLTGQHHWRKFHEYASAFARSKFDAAELTLPEMMQDQGYTTAAIGKWHLGWEWSSIRKPDAKQIEQNGKKVWGPEAFDWSKPIADGPTAHGFDYYFGDTVINMPPYTWIENDRVLMEPDILMDTKLFKPIKEGNWGCRPGPMATGWDPYENIPTTTAKAVEKIEEYAKSETPFFMYFAFPSPHVPIIPNDEFDGSSEAGAYGDFIVETDAAVSVLLHALEQAGIADNTIVIFSADNGAESHAYSRDSEFGHWSSAPLRGVKRDIYEGGHRVPTIIRWPAVVEAGAVSNALVSQIDIMGTLASILNVDLPRDQAIDSHDLLPVLSGKSESVRDTHVHNTYHYAYAIRHGDWVLINDQSDSSQKSNLWWQKRHGWEKRHGYPEEDSLPVELYDLSEDIGQRKNLAAEHPEMVATLQERLSQIKTGRGTAPRLRDQ